MNLEKQGRKCPAFAEEKGDAAASSIYAAKIFEALFNMQENFPELIGPDGKVIEVYGSFRSFRCGSLTHSRNMEVCPADIGCDKVDGDK
jgi:hypothetical protein